MLILVSLAVALAARPALLLIPPLPEALAQDERLALFQFLQDIAAITDINIIALQSNIADDEGQLFSSVQPDQQQRFCSFCPHELRRIPKG